MNRGYPQREKPRSRAMSAFLLCAAALVSAWTLSKAFSWEDFSVGVVSSMGIWPGYSRYDSDLFSNDVAFPQHCNFDRENVEKPLFLGQLPKPCELSQPWVRQEMFVRNEFQLLKSIHMSYQQLFGTLSRL